jgi:hypothetical protein
MIINGKKLPFETIPGMGAWQINGEGGEFKYYMFDLLAIY